jgi:hypothetical protein
MRRIIDIGFVLVLVLGCIALDFYILKRDSAKESFGISDYIAHRKDNFNDLLYPPSLAAALPTAIEGWEISPKNADKMVGVTDANREDQAHEIALVKAMAALTKAASDKGEMVGMTMSKGETRLRLVATLIQEADLPAGIETANTAPTDDTAALQAMLQAGDTAAGQAVYDVVDGVAFTELPSAGVTGDPDIRMIRAALTPALSVTVITQSNDDAAIKEALQAIDFVMLNKLLNTPIEGVIEGSKIDLRGGQPNANLGNTTAKLTPAAVPLPARDTGRAAKPFSLPTVAPAKAAAAPPKTDTTVQPSETAVFLAPPAGELGQSKQPCVRRAGVLVCPDG